MTIAAFDFLSWLERWVNDKIKSFGTLTRAYHYRTIDENTSVYVWRYNWGKGSFLFPFSLTMSDKEIMIVYSKFLATDFELSHNHKIEDFMNTTLKNLLNGSKEFSNEDKDHVFYYDLEGEPNPEEVKKSVVQLLRVPNDRLRDDKE